MTAWDDGSGSFEEQLSWANDEVKRLESQLATQTERVRVMREALKKIANPKEWPHKPCEDVADWMSELSEQALNQESLGDGGNGE